MRLTKHFVENWQKRVGGMPSPDGVEAIIQGAVVVQQGKHVGPPVIYRPGMQVKNTLSIYWHPNLDLVILVDPFSNVAVSVLSKANMPKSRPKRRAGRKKGKRYGINR